MSDSVKEFVVRLIEKKARLPKDIEIDKINYVDSGYVDSLGIIKFVVDIESKYDIEITDGDIESPEFRTIGGIISIISCKIANRTNNE